MTFPGEVDAELQSLLAEGETVLESVRRCAERLAEFGIWHQFSRNEPATSCPDAARKRNRLGHKGIPLWDELKSFLGEYHDGPHTRKIFLAHCRGDRKLDLEKLRHALKSTGEIRRVSLKTEERLWADHRVGYGTVNPLMDIAGGLQIFDEELRHIVGVPGTVMTNAGDFTWAVEFDSAELARNLPDSRWADIIQSEMEAEDPIRWGVREPEAIGILTGNPCDSGLDLCTSVNAHVRRLLKGNSLGDVSMPRIVIISTPQIGISMEMDKRETPLREALVQAVEELCATGAKILAHPAHTTHYFTLDIATRAAERGARFLSMAELTAERLRMSGVQEIALLGTRYVTDLSQPWSVYKNAFEGLKIHTPSLNGWNKIHELGYEVQQRGPTPLCFNWMRDLLRDEVPTSCKHVVLAMTEFTPIVRRLKARGLQGKILIDPVDIYGEAIAYEYLGLST
jgi:aspartate/glutamate racemase